MRGVPGMGAQAAFFSTKLHKKLFADRYSVNPAMEECHWNPSTRNKPHSRLHSPDFRIGEGVESVVAVHSNLYFFEGFSYIAFAKIPTKCCE